jgi:hypothetical protein
MTLVLRPSEYCGEPGTSVGGRVVLRRKCNLRDNAAEQITPKKGKGKKKATKEAISDDKCEIHLLGGEDMSEMLFIEAWGECAGVLYNLATASSLVKVSGSKSSTALSLSLSLPLSLALSLSLSLDL